VGEGERSKKEMIVDKKERLGRKKRKVQVGVGEECGGD